MINLSKCLICGTGDNLNTSLSIKLEDGNVTVVVCDLHSEDLTVKSAKEKYLEKKAIIDKLIQEAKEQGLEITMPTGKGLVMVSNNALATQAPVQEIKTTPIIESADSDMMSGSVARQRLGTAKSVSGMIDRVANVSQESELSRNEFEEHADFGEEKIKIGLVEGRSGLPVPVPTVIKDRAGTTHIRVRKSMTDAQLQNTFKSLAASNDDHGNNKHSFGADGYALAECGFCNGNGSIHTMKNKIKTQEVCPKCNGAGVIQRDIR